MLHFFILILNIVQYHADVEAQNRVKVVQAGDNVTFTCVFQKGARTSVLWVKQRVGEKPLAIVSSFQALDETFENYFDKENRFFVFKDDSSFNLSITNTKELDTATYYCVKYIFKFEIGKGTDLIVKAGSVSLDSVSPSDSAALRCSVLTPHCAGGHNVYWFRHQSGESPPGIIYTQEQRNAQCERSSELNNTQNKCFYSLPRTNNSLQDDTGIYSCAVAACGQILFGDARQVDFTGKCFQVHWTIATLVITTLSVIVIMIMGARLYKYHQKDVMHNTQHSQLMVEDADALNYAALNFKQKPSSSGRPREQNMKDNTIYARHQ